MIEQLNLNTLAGAALANLFADTGTTQPVILDENGEPIVIDPATEEGTEGAAAATEGPTLTFGADGSFSISGNIPGLTAGVGDDGPSKFSTVNPYEYNLTREFIINTYFGGDTEGRDVSVVGSFVNAWAERLAEQTGTDERGNPIWSFPSFEDFTRNATFNQGAAFLPMAGQIPQSQVVMADPDENGDFSAYYRITYDPLEGLQQEAIDPQTFFGAETPGTFEVGQSQVANLRPEILEKLDPQTQAALTGNATVTSGTGGQFTILPEVIPLSEYIQQFLKPPEAPARRGGAAAPKIDFDRRKLIQDASDRWRGWLWEDPSPRRIEELVDKYINEATGFWKRSGGRIINYDAFVREQLEGTSRYKTLYRFKPQDVDTDSFIQQMTSPIASLGISPDATRTRQLEALQSGGSATGQVRRVANTTGEGRAATQFSRRMAQTLSGLGAGGRT